MALTLLSRPSRVYCNHVPLHNTVVQCLASTMLSFVCITYILRSILNRHQRDRLRVEHDVHFCSPCLHFRLRAAPLTSLSRYAKLLDRKLSTRERERAAKGTPMQRFVTTFSNCNGATETFETTALHVITPRKIR